MSDCLPSASAATPSNDEVSHTKWFKTKVRQKRRERRLAKGLPVSDDEEPESEPEEGRSLCKNTISWLDRLADSFLGVEILFKGVARGHQVELHHGNVAVKRARGLYLGEADALRIAETAGLPVPHVHSAGDIDGNCYIRMDFIPGQTLEKVWKDMSSQEKRAIAGQLRHLITVMRSTPPPSQIISYCDGTGIRDSRAYTTYNGPTCSDEQAFNDYLLSGLNPKTPPAVRDAFAGKLKTNHRVVLSHCDLAPRNIIVRDGKIVALIDWADAGWYPEYWEYVKFFQRNLPKNDFWCYAAEIFPQLYQDELVDYIALLTWQMP